MTRIVLAVLVLTGASTAAHAQTADEILYHEAMYKETVEGDLRGAVEMYRDVLTRAGRRGVRAGRTMIRLARCYEQMGRTQNARAQFQAAASAVETQAPVAVAARRGLAALDARSAPTPSGAKNGERERIARELHALKAELQERQREVEARDRNVRTLRHRVAELQTLLARAGDPAADADLAAARAARSESDRRQLAAHLRDAAHARRASRHTSAILAARAALRICQRLDRAGMSDPESEARARELLGQASLALAQRDWRAGEVAGRPIRAVVTLLAAPRSLVQGLAKSTGIVLEPVAAPPAARGSAAAVARLDSVQVDALLGLRGVRAIDGGRREVSTTGPPATALVGTDAGAGCLVRLSAPQDGADRNQFDVRFTAWRLETDGLDLGGTVLARRVLEHARVARAIPSGGTLLVAGVRSPFAAGGELLLLIHSPVKSTAPRSPATPAGG